MVLSSGRPSQPVFAFTFLFFIQFAGAAGNPGQLEGGAEHVAHGADGEGAVEEGENGEREGRERGRKRERKREKERERKRETGVILDLVLNELVTS